MNPLRTDIDRSADDMISNSLNDTIIRARTDEKMREKHEAELQKYKNKGDGKSGRPYRGHSFDLFCILSILSVLAFLGVALALLVYRNKHNHFMERYLPENIQARHDGLGFDHIFAVEWLPPSKPSNTKDFDALTENRDAELARSIMNKTSHDLKFTYAPITLSNPGPKSQAGGGGFTQLASLECWTPYRPVLEVFLADSNAQEMLVLDMDTGLQTNVRLRLLHVLTGVPHPWDVIELNEPRFVDKHQEGSSEDFYISGTPLHYRNIRGGGCPWGGYAISRPGAQHILRWLNPSSTTHDFSQNMKEAIGKDKFFVYRAYPPLLKPEFLGTFK